MARPKDVQDYVDKIEEMLLDERYEFAEEFLSSVLSFAKEMPADKAYELERIGYELLTMSRKEWSGIAA